LSRFALVVGESKPLVAGLINRTVVRTANDHGNSAVGQLVDGILVEAAPAPLEVNLDRLAQVPADRPVGW
jgi:acetylglutamate kinase